MTNVLLTIMLLVLVMADVTATNDIEEVIRQNHATCEVRTIENARLSRGDWQVYLIMRNSLSDVENAEKQLIDEAKLLLKWVMKIPCSDIVTVTQHAGRNVYGMLTPCNELWKSNLRQRLESISKPRHTPLYEVTIDENKPNGMRKRRGLVNLVGQVSKWLFGTATDADMKKVLGLVKAQRNQGKKIAHEVSELATVVDHALEDISDTRNDLSHALYVLRNVNELQEVQVNINNIRTEVTRAEYYVSALADLSFKLENIRQHHEDNMQDLSSGRVTEKLFPTAIYDEIEQLTVEMNYEIPPSNWVYLHRHLELLGVGEGQAIFRVSIPVMEQSLYQLYDLSPVLQLSNESLVSIQVTPRILYDTLGSQRAAEPNSCRGSDPVVCDPVPIWDTQAFTCELGLITRHMDSTSACKFIRQPIPEKAILEINKEKTTLLLPVEETILLACSGQREQRKTIIRGAYVAKVPSECVLSGRRWTIKGTMINIKNYTIMEEPLSIPLPEWTLDTIEMSNNNTNRQEIDDIINHLQRHAENAGRTKERLDNIVETLDKVQNDDINFDISPTIMDYVQWVFIAIAILCLLIMMICICVYKKKLVYVFGNPFARKRKEKVEEKIELKKVKDSDPKDEVSVNIV